MKDSENVLETANTAWDLEKERVENNRELSFGFVFLIEAIDDIRIEMSRQNVFGSGVLLGQLLQIIIENKKYFNEE